MYTSLLQCPPVCSPPPMSAWRAGKSTSPCLFLCLCFLALDLMITWFSVNVYWINWTELNGALWLPISLAFVLSLTLAIAFGLDLNKSLAFSLGWKWLSGLSVLQNLWGSNKDPRTFSWILSLWVQTLAWIKFEFLYLSGPCNLGNLHTESQPLLSPGHAQTCCRPVPQRAVSEEVLIPIDGKKGRIRWWWNAVGNQG